MQKIIYWSVAFFMMAIVGLGTAVQAGTLRTQLESLAQQNGIRLEGLEQLGDEPEKSAEGDVAQRLKSLLADYNFMTVGQGNKIERVTITSLKNVSPKPKSSGTLKTQRYGVHHQVQASLTGPDNSKLSVSLLVDTGATTLVLPDSMIRKLGFSRENLQAGVSQTAAGSVPVMNGNLKSVRIGEVSADNVPVSFINDQKLNGARLLGMSFLNRFRFSLDDENNELILMSK